MWCTRKLRALNYPQWSSFDLSNFSHVQTLVAWLEDTKIRAYPVEDRAPLRTLDGEWELQFRKYLQQLHFPHKSNMDFAAGHWTIVVNWLLAYAMSLEYRDNAEKYNEQALRQAEAKQTKKHPINTADYNSAQFLSSLKELTTLLHIPMHDDPAVLLNSIRKAVKNKFSPAALAQHKVDVAGEAGLHLDTSISDAKFPLGFNTGDSNLNKASTILRLLYIKDLRELQTNINDLIVSVQAFTANPKTNATLGKVGR